MEKINAFDNEMKLCVDFWIILKLIGKNNL